MRKTILTSLAITLLINAVNAQTNTFPASGNVGIGTFTPISTLHVGGNISLNAATDINNTYLLFQRSSDGYIGSRIGNAYAMNGYQGHLVFETNTGGSSSSLSEQMRITTNGNVGIGTTMPEAKLHLQDGSVFVKTLRLGQNIDYPLIYGTQAVNGVSGHAGLYLYEDGSGGFGQASGLSLKTSTNDALPQTRLLIKSNGNIGIGTTAPNGRLEVAAPEGNMSSGVFHTNGGQSWGHVLTLASDLNTGNDDARLLLSYRNKAKQWAIGGRSNINSFSIWEDPGDGVFGNGFGIARLTVEQGGNVGIGTSSPAEKLSVNGNIRAKEIKVETANWPDYVFDQDYKVLGLQELESYIKVNKHLPDMPSAVDVQKNGVELGDVVKKLLKNQEELTLYIIEQSKKIERQNTEISELRKIVNSNQKFKN